MDKKGLQTPREEDEWRGKNDGLWVLKMARNSKFRHNIYYNIPKGYEHVIIKKGAQK